MVLDKIQVGNVRAFNRVQSKINHIWAQNRPDIEMITWTAKQWATIGSMAKNTIIKEYNKQTHQVIYEV